MLSALRCIYLLSFLFFLLLLSCYTFEHISFCYLLSTSLARARWRFLLFYTWRLPITVLTATFFVVFFLLFLYLFFVFFFFCLLLYIFCYKGSVYFSRFKGVAGLYLIYLCATFICLCFHPRLSLILVEAFYFELFWGLN